VTPPPGEPSPAVPRGVYGVSLAATILGTAGVAALLALLLRHEQRSSVWSGFLMLCAVVVLFLIGTLVSRRWLRIHERFTTTTEGLEDRIFGRGPFGVVMHVRGRVDGVGCRVTRHAIEVEVPSTTPRVLPAAVLREIAAGSKESLVLAVFAAKPEARAAASGLLAAGKNVAVHLEAGKARLVGAGSATADAAALARLLTVIARAPALALAKASDAACPYCKDEVKKKEAEGTFRCPTCDTLHHTPCWNEHGGCAIFGCERAPAEGRTGTRARA
jgi:hypothetical protein